MEDDFDGWMAFARANGFVSVDPLVPSGVPVSPSVASDTTPLLPIGVDVSGSGSGGNIVLSRVENGSSVNTGHLANVVVNDESVERVSVVSGSSSGLPVARSAGHSATGQGTDAVTSNIVGGINQGVAGAKATVASTFIKYSIIPLMFKYALIYFDPFNLNRS